MRQLLFALTFPKSHPRAGQPTRFPEAIWAGLERGSWPGECYTLKEPPDGIDFDWDHFRNCPRIKYHTMRAGRHWKAGDRFIPRSWSGRPYRSPMITMGPALNAKKIWNIEIWPNGHTIVSGKVFGQLFQPEDNIIRLADSDGLSPEDFAAWFRSRDMFSGQIICWNDKINY